MAATSISTPIPATHDSEESTASSSSFLHILIYISITYLYFHSIFLSDGNNYIIVPVPLRNQNQNQTMTSTTTTTNANIKNAVRIKSYLTHREYLRVPRSLPHLKAVNSLVEYQIQLDKYEKKRNKDKDNDNEDASEGEGEGKGKEGKGGEGNMSTKTKSATDGNSENGTNEKAASKTPTPYADSLTLWSSIIVPCLMLMCFSLSCRCLLAILIYRRLQHAQNSNEFDIAGQRRRPHSYSPTNLEAAADFWQIFRTIPLRSRSRTRSRTRTRTRTMGARRGGGTSILPTINTNENPSVGVGQELRQQMLESMTRRLNEERIANGSQPLSPSSLEFLLSRSTNNEDGFSGEDYNRLWSMEEANGHGNSNGNNGNGLDEEDIARFPVRLLEADDDLLLPIINHDHRHRHHQVSDDTNIGYDSDSDNDSDDDNNHGNSKCSICLEEFKVGDMVRTIPCFHEFHAQCIDQWLQLKDTCPICIHVCKDDATRSASEG